MRRRVPATPQAVRKSRDAKRAKSHAALHEKYRVDDNARDVAIANARRRYPAANHAAEPIVIYDLMRSQAFRGEIEK